MKHIGSNKKIAVAIGTVLLAMVCTACGEDKGVETLSPEPIPMISPIPSMSEEATSVEWDGGYESAEESRESDEGSEPESAEESHSVEVERPSIQESSAAESSVENSSPAESEPASSEVSVGKPSVPESSAEQSSVPAESEPSDVWQDSPDDRVVIELPIIPIN